ncbi:ribosomal protein S10 domain-containing protein [Trametes gibbosa]|nr:ribosomal protein S10 domain-containing protein [Trametes gibbosa]
MLSRSCRSAVSAVRGCLRYNSTSAAPAVASADSATPVRIPIPQLTEPEYAARVVDGRSLRPPYQLPKTHGIPVATLHFRSYHPRLLDLFIHFAGHAATALGIPVSKPVHLPTQRRLWTVIRGPFVHKKSQENFERRTHKRLIKAWDANPEAVDMLVQYLEKHLGAGVGFRAVKWTRAPVGVGQKTLESVMGQLRLDQQVRAEKVKALGEQIIKEELAAAASPAKEGTVTTKASATESS